MRDKLLFESKIADKEQKKDIPEGDAYQSIQEVRVEAISRAVSREIPRAISIAIFTAVSREISRVIAEEKARKVEEGNQQ